MPFLALVLKVAGAAGLAAFAAEVGLAGLAGPWLPLTACAGFGSLIGLLFRVRLVAGLGYPFRDAVQLRNGDAFLQRPAGAYGLKKAFDATGREFDKGFGLLNSDRADVAFGDIPGAAQHWQ